MRPCVSRARLGWNLRDRSVELGPSILDADQTHEQVSDDGAGLLFEGLAVEPESGPPSARTTRTATLGRRVVLPALAPAVSASPQARQKSEPEGF